MSGTKKPKRFWQTLIFGLGALMAISTTGCQVDVGGQTLPSAYYLQDDVQYHPTGPEFKLAREAAAQKAYSQEAAAQYRQP
jgi:hypothetical protein